MKAMWQRVRTAALWPFQKLWSLLVWLYAQSKQKSLATWRFLSRTSSKFLGPIWRPIRWLLTPLIWMWRYLGKLGLALTKILNLIVWPVAQLLRLIGRFFNWLWQQAKSYVLLRWTASQPARMRRRRRWRSKQQIWRARLRVMLTRPRKPANAHVALAPIIETPSASKTGRWIIVTGTAMAAILAISSVVYLRFIERQTVAAETLAQASLFERIAAAQASPTPSVTPTATPTLTPSPTPTPTPAIIALTPWPTPNPLAGGGSIAFVMNQEGNSDLFVLSVGQDRPVRLTTDPAVDRDPAWSPDGRSLAFTSQRSGNWDVFVLDLPTGDIQQITTGLAFDGGPSWSPDGQWLVYESYQNENLDIYIVKRDGSEGPIRLTEAAEPDFAPVWSPDGRHIAFTSWRSGNKDIFLMSLDEVRDDRAINLTNTPDRSEDQAAFHPAGRYLAYYDNSGGVELVFAQPLEDYRPSGEPVTLGQGRDPAWAPNGDNLAYAHSRNGQEYLIASSVDAWAVAPQTFASDGRISSPVWSAITFAQKPAGYLADIAGQSDPPLYVESVNKSDEKPDYQLFTIGVNAPFPFLSDRVEQSFLALRERSRQDVGWDFMANLDRVFEPIDTRPQPNESTQTWHKAGRAFDVSDDLANSFNPQLEVVREDINEETYWRIYVRTASQDGTQGEPLRDIPWDFRARFGDDPTYYDQGGKLKASIPAGYYIDYTDLATDYGWARVPAGDNWRLYYPDIRFWQFEKRQGLSWDAAMREIYTTDELATTFGN